MDPDDGPKTPEPRDTPRDNRDNLYAVRCLLVGIAACFALVGFVAIGALDRDAGAATAGDAARQALVSSPKRQPASAGAEVGRPCDEKAGRDAPAPYIPPDP